jgi:lysophospholipase L1-like esterase
MVKWPKVLLLGDSLTQFGFGANGCWVALLADALQRKCDVINRGLSGYNSQVGSDIP